MKSSANVSCLEPSKTFKGIIIFEQVFNYIALKIGQKPFCLPAIQSHQIENNNYLIDSKDFIL